MMNDPSRPDLEEKKDTLRFFKCHPHLSAFIGRYKVNLVDYKNIRVCHEFNLFGDHVADLAVGDATANEYCFIEFENATKTSIFKAVPRMTPEWSSRFEHGFSQLVDWILWIENNRNTAGLAARFNAPSIRDITLLVIGRVWHLADQGLKDRLTWRNDQVLVAAKTVSCITFDKLCEDLSTRYRWFTN